MQPLSTAFSPVRSTLCASVIKPTEITSGESGQFISDLKSPTLPTTMNFDILYRLQPDATDPMKYATPLLSDGSRLFVDLSVAGQCTIQAASSEQNATSITLTPRHPFYATITAIPDHLPLSPTAHLLKLHKPGELLMPPLPPDATAETEKHHTFPARNDTRMKMRRGTLPEKTDFTEARPVFSPTKTNSVFECLTYCLKYEVKPSLAEKWAFLELFRGLHPQKDDPQCHYATSMNSAGNSVSVNILTNKKLHVVLNSLNHDYASFYIAPQHPLYLAMTTGFPASLIAHE